MRCLRLGAGLLGALTIVGAVGAAEPAAPQPKGPVVELPKFEVTDSRLLPPQEAWRYAQIPGFEILSNMSANATKRFVEDFLLLQIVIEVIMPGLARGNIPVPTALILTGKGNSFDQFVPTEQEETRYGRNTLFFQNPERSAIVVDFALAELQLSDNSTEESDPYRGFYLEYFRFLVRKHSTTKPPDWFEEGLVQIFAAMDFNRKWITFAQIGDGFGGPKTGDFNRRLSQRALIPFKDFLATSPLDAAMGPPPARRRDAFWSAQCYAWVHMCLYGQNQKFQKGFLQYVKRLATEEPTEELFKECFKIDYNKMALELRGYVDFTNYKAMQYTAKKGQELPKPPPIDLKDAPDAVVGRLKGEVLRMAGHGENARNALIAPYVRGERDPRLLAALGLDEKLAGKNDRARKFLEAASNAKVDRATAYLELARLRFDEARAVPGGANGQLSAVQVGGVLTPLFTARKTPPSMADVYALIAQTWTLSEQAPEREHFEVVVEGVKLFPRDTSLVMDAAMLAAKRGFPHDAVALAKLGMRVSKEPGERDRFEILASAFKRDANGDEVAAQADADAKKQDAPAPARTPGPVLQDLK
ncbi:MAG: hypothetical protein V4773_10010 [Verrucomicrobiota bacterium]